MSGEGAGGAVLKGLVHVATYPIGRIVMLILASPFLLLGYGVMTGPPTPGRGVPLVLIPLIGGLLTLIALIGAWKDRQRSRPGPIRWFLLRLAMAGIILGGAMLVTWLRSRWRKAEVAPPPAPPQPEDVDRLCREQQLEARAG